MNEKHFVQQVTIEEQINEVKREIAMRQMSEKLYFVGLTFVSEFLLSHEKDQPLFFLDWTTGNRRRSRHNPREMDGLLIGHSIGRLSLLSANNRLHGQNQR